MATDRSQSLTGVSREQKRTLSRKLGREYCIFGIMLNFLNMIGVLWLWREMSLLLGDTR